ncbi:hypothetical protein GCM10023187_37780 [Nibrella viscosa]|uniref:Secreted protein n=2 Tax=Nibrella viscosa TaxID=1084524 RepID=A0ABP8KNB6_9BACT
MGALLLTVCLSCSGNSNENTTGTTPPVMGRKGDTTMSTVPGDAPIQAPADSTSAQGRTLLRVEVTPDNAKQSN